MAAADGSVATADVDGDNIADGDGDDGGRKVS